MKIKFERVYGKHKIGDIVEFEKGEELNYILTTKTALIIEDDDFGNNEIDEAEDNSDRENSEDNNEAGKSGKNKKK
ncbi:hypothetical protein [Fusobacterium animalis]|jgi:hypothetical protein|uniref:hypothetical protein n=1 Tax=Fusobacterium animalis TaxID=76859 RepID=UPI0030CA9AAC